VCSAMFGDEKVSDFWGSNLLYLCCLAFGGQIIASTQ
jgi:hypothetical protein